MFAAFGRHHPAAGHAGWAERARRYVLQPLRALAGEMGGRDGGGGLNQVLSVDAGGWVAL